MLKTMVHKIINPIQQNSLLCPKLRRWLLTSVGCNLHKTSVIASNVFIGSCELTMHANSFVNVFCFLDGCAEIILEEWVRLGPHVKILTGTHIPNKSVLRRSPPSKDLFLPVVIKRGAWIGMGAIIMPGVIIAKGCIIGAGSVVLKSTEPNGLYAGNPAKRIKDLEVED